MINTFRCGYCNVEQGGGVVGDDMKCTGCGHQFTFHLSRIFLEHPLNLPPPKEKGDWYRDFLGYRGRLEDPYDQEDFDYSHEGYRESDY